MDFDLANIAFTASVWVLPVLIAITFHEAAHGWTAWRLGDDTAFRLGRVTFNPLRHIDSFGTILLPSLILLGSGGRLIFGYAKPVPVNFEGLGSPRRDMVLVAAAGPASNMLLAILSALLLHATALVDGDFREWLGHNLVNSVRINVLLCVFNLLPLPPLDGGRIAVGILPASLARPLARMERAGIGILLGLMFVLPMVGRQLGIDLDVFRWIILIPAEFLTGVIFTATGIL